ncbi:4Fe-4S dicluster domain-containing protein [Dorea sp. ICN-14282]
MIEILTERCTGCGACVADCPGRALKLVEERRNMSETVFTADTAWRSVR